jgi:uncharacterized membrane protein YfcA
MSIPAILLGILFVAISIFMIIKARKKTAALKKYELENSSSDGVVQFENIDLSRSHTADKGLYTVLTIVGFLVGVVGGMLLVAGVNV